ncbi:hypothetical protein GGR56DRAFT_613292 [Xylariaceae sp. FL0804]|nr:hypothetical protein GGR56DRAFT_613292 [Xylariaceae sp. FL0804]
MQGETQAPSALLDPKVKEIERDYMRRSGGDIRKVMELYLQRNVSEGERWPRLEKGMEFQKKMRSEPFKLLKGKDGPSSAKDSGFPKSKRHTSSGQSSGQALSQLSGQSSRPQHQEVPISGNKEGLHSLNGSAPKESQPLLAEDQQVTAPIAYPADETADPDQPPSNAVQKKAGEPRKKKRHLMDNLQSDLGVKWAPNVTEDGYRPTRQR